jgi:hypothetical protein
MSYVIVAFVFLVIGFYVGCRLNVWVWKFQIRFIPSYRHWHQLGEAHKEACHRSSELMNNGKFGTEEFEMAEAERKALYAETMLADPTKLSSVASGNEVR